MGMDSLSNGLRNNPGLAREFQRQFGLPPKTPPGIPPVNIPTPPKVNIPGLGATLGTLATLGYFTPPIYNQLFNNTGEKDNVLPPLSTGFYRCYIQTEDHNGQKYGYQQVSVSGGIRDFFTTMRTPQLTRVSGYGVQNQAGHGLEAWGVDGGIGVGILTVESKGYPRNGNSAMKYGATKIVRITRNDAIEEPLVVPPTQNVSPGARTTSPPARGGSPPLTTTPPYGPTAPFTPNLPSYQTPAFSPNPTFTPPTTKPTSTDPLGEARNKPTSSPPYFSPNPPYSPPATKPVTGTGTGSNTGSGTGTGTSTGAGTRAVSPPSTLTGGGVLAPGITGVLNPPLYIDPRIIYGDYPPDYYDDNPPYRYPDIPKNDEVTDIIPVLEGGDLTKPEDKGGELDFPTAKTEDPNAKPDPEEDNNPLPPPVLPPVATADFVCKFKELVENVTTEFTSERCSELRENPPENATPEEIAEFNKENVFSETIEGKNFFGIAKMLKGLSEQIDHFRQDLCLLNNEGDLVIPDSWEVTVPKQVPQLIVSFKEKLQEDKWGQSTWSIVIPMYGVSPIVTKEAAKAIWKDFKYTRGSEYGVLTLNNNTKIVCNVKNVKEAEKIVNKALEKIKRDLIPANRNPRMVTRKGRDIVEKEVHASYLNYYANGLRTDNGNKLRPTWFVDLKD